MKTSIVRFSVGAILLSNLMYGQTDVSRLTGVIADASGAVIPAATVTITNEQTGQLRKVESNEHGMYAAPQLWPALYSAKAESPNMRPSACTAIGMRRG